VGLAFIFGSVLLQTAMGMPIACLDLPAILFQGKAWHDLEKSLRSHIASSSMPPFDQAGMTDSSLITVGVLFNFLS
jgi:hypothetical protein